MNTLRTLNKTVIQKRYVNEIRCNHRLLKCDAFRRRKLCKWCPLRFDYKPLWYGRYEAWDDTPQTDKFCVEH